MPEEPVHLELSAWIHEAKEHGVIATIDDIASFSLNQGRLLVPLELTSFHLCEAGETKAPQQPIDFFEGHLIRFVRKQGLTAKYILTETGWETRPCVVGTYTYPNQVNEIEERPIIGKSWQGDRQAESCASGDGWTRFILMQRLVVSNMPLVSFTPEIPLW